MIVIDASALAKFILREEGWEELIEFLKSGTVSVDHVAKEVANAIWRRSVREKLNVKEVWRMFQALKEILNKNVVMEGELRYLNEAFKIAVEHRVTVYDGLYISQAKKLRLKLLTSDSKQAQVAKAVGVEVSELK